MKILDACCGGKMFWYEKDLNFVDFQVFGDKRSKTRWTVFVKNSVLKKGKDDE